MVAPAQAMDGTILKVTMIPRPGFGCMIMLQSQPAPTQSIYQLTKNSLPECNCSAFKDIISKFGRKQNSIRHCKHLYFICVKVSNVDPNVDLFIYAPAFSFNKIKLILKGASCHNLLPKITPILTLPITLRSLVTAHIAVSFSK